MSDPRVATVLVVDDTEANRFFVSRVLAGAGYAVTQAASGAEALARAAERPDLIVLDVRLPDAMGFDIVRTLKRDPATASIPVMILSASFATEDAKVFGLESGADGYLTHPVVPSVLLATVHSLLRIRRAEERQRLLADASAMLATSLGMDETLSHAVRTAVPRFADWAVVYTNDLAGRPQPARWAHHEADGEAALALALADGGPPEGWDAHPVLAAPRTGRPVFLPQFDAASLQPADGAAAGRDALRALDARSVIAAPLLTRGRTLGVIVYARVAGRAPFDHGDAALAEELAGRVALALDNARLFVEAETARRDAEAARLQAEEANQAKSEFLATMSHELRTPLNAISGYVQLLDLGLRGPVTDEQREFFARILRSQRHLASLIDEVLGFAKLEAGQVRVDAEDFALGEALADVDAVVGLQMAERQLGFEVRRCGDEVRVRGDRARVRQILLNLLSNAMKFTRPGGRITVECEARPAHVAVLVRDTGRGIPPEKLEAIFEPFVQVDSRLTRTAEGVGLGLAISRDLARAMGGELAVRSTVGDGSTFELTLPRAVARPGDGAR